VARDTPRTEAEQRLAGQWAVDLLGRMYDEYTKRAGEKPQSIVTTPEVWYDYESACPKGPIGPKPAWRLLEFRGCPVLYDRGVPSGFAYCLGVRLGGMEVFDDGE
jgi:hypothetical protein